MTETHLSKKEEEIRKFGKYLQEYTLHHVHDKHKASRRKGVTIGIKKNIVGEVDVKFTPDEGLEDEGRWIKMELSNVLDKTVSIMGIYAPTKAQERIKWLTSLQTEIQKTEGYRIIAGDFNFVMDTTMDKRG